MLWFLEEAGRELQPENKVYLLGNDSGRKAEKCGGHALLGSPPWGSWQQHRPGSWRGRKGGPGAAGPGMEGG